jgi:hypothetical protein
MAAKKSSFGYEAVISALRSHSSKSMTGSEDDIFMAAVAFWKETDRGAVILATTAFEDELQRALLAMFQPLNATEKGQLFGFDAPLRSFSAKIRIAHALGILDKPRKRIAEVARVMRNTCAHAGQSTSFYDKALMDGLYFMLQEVGYDGDEVGLKLWSDDRPDFPRFIFLTLVNDLVGSVTRDEASPGPAYSDMFHAYLGYRAAVEEGLIPEVSIRPTRWDRGDRKEPKPPRQPGSSPK